MTTDDKDAGGDSERGAERDRALTDIKADFGALVAEHPVGALAVALGAGYALGGGVFTRLTSRLLRLGLRLGIQFAVMPVIEQELAAMAGLARANGAGADPPEKNTTHH